MRRITSKPNHPIPYLVCLLVYAFPPLLLLFRPLGLFLLQLHPRLARLGLLEREYRSRRILLRPHPPTAAGQYPPVAAFLPRRPPPPPAAAAAVYLFFFF